MGWSILAFAGNCLAGVIGLGLIIFVVFPVFLICILFALSPFCGLWDELMEKVDKKVEEKENKKKKTRM